MEATPEATVSKSMGRVKEEGINLGAGEDQEPVEFKHSIGKKSQSRRKAVVMPFLFTSFDASS